MGIHRTADRGEERAFDIQGAFVSTTARAEQRGGSEAMLYWNLVVCVSGRACQRSTRETSEGERGGGSGRARNFDCFYGRSQSNTITEPMHTQYIKAVELID